MVEASCLLATGGLGSALCVGAGVALTGLTIADGKANRGMSDGEAIAVGALGALGAYGGPLIGSIAKTGGGVATPTTEAIVTNLVTNLPAIEVSVGSAYANWRRGDQ